MPECSPRVRAYMVASEILERAKCQPGHFDRATARQVNAEIKKIAKMLERSMLRIYTNENIKQMCAHDPELAEKYELNKKWRIIINGNKAFERAKKAARELHK